MKTRTTKSSPLVQLINNKAVPVNSNNKAMAAGDTSDDDDGGLVNRKPRKKQNSTIIANDSSDDSDSEPSVFVHKQHDDQTDSDNEDRAVYKDDSSNIWGTLEGKEGRVFVKELQKLFYEHTPNLNGFRCYDDKHSLWLHQQFVKFITQYGSPVKTLLVAHQTGSGKTRTISAILKNNDEAVHNDRRMRVIIVMDPTLKSQMLRELFEDAIGKPVSDKQWSDDSLQKDFANKISYNFGKTYNEVGNLKMMALRAFKTHGTLVQKFNVGRYYIQNWGRSPITVYTLQEFLKSYTELLPHLTSKGGQLAKRLGFFQESNHNKLSLSDDKVFVFDEAHMLYHPAIQTQHGINLKTCLEDMKKSKDKKHGLLAYFLTATPTKKLYELTTDLALSRQGKQNTPETNIGFVSMFSDAMPQPMYPMIIPARDEPSVCKLDNNAFVVEGMQCRAHVDPVAEAVRLVVLYIYNTSYRNMTNQKCIIYVDNIHKQKLIETLEEYRIGFIQHFLAEGGTSAKNVTARFNQDDNCKVLLLGRGKEQGLNPKNVILWITLMAFDDYKMLLQAMGRATRGCAHGQDKEDTPLQTVQYYYIIDSKSALVDMQPFNDSKKEYIELRDYLMERAVDTVTDTTQKYVSIYNMPHKFSSTELTKTSIGTPTDDHYVLKQGVVNELDTGYYYWDNLPRFGPTYIFWQTQKLPTNKGVMDGIIDNCKSLHNKRSNAMRVSLCNQFLKLADCPYIDERTVWQTTIREEAKKVEEKGQFLTDNYFVYQALKPLISKAKTLVKVNKKQAKKQRVSSNSPKYEFEEEQPEVDMRQVINDGVEDLLRPYAQNKHLVNMVYQELRRTARL